MPPFVAQFYSMLLSATTDGRIPDEASEITATFEKSLDLLNIWNDQVAERDGIIVERDAIIAQRNTKIERLRKQRSWLIYSIIAIVAIFTTVFTFALIGAQNWFK